jgi:hypothetical protein
VRELGGMSNRNGRPGPPPLNPDNPFSEGRHYDIDQATGCWVWRLFKSRGYGMTSRGRRAHRVQYAALIGPIPDGYDVHHECENTACINPGHLALKLPSPHRSDHQRDAKALLTVAQVVEIRERAAAGEVQNRLAEEYGVPFRHISDIVRGRRWKDAPGPIKGKA